LSLHWQMCVCLCAFVRVCMCMCACVGGNSGRINTKRGYDATGTSTFEPDKRLFFNQKELTVQIDAYLTNHGSKKVRKPKTIERYLRVATHYFSFVSNELKITGPSIQLDCQALVEPSRQTKYMQTLSAKTAKTNAGDFFLELRKFLLYSLPLEKPYKEFRSILLSLDSHTKDQQ
jgi:hypothetical protein